MAETIHFTYYLPDDTELSVSATVTPGLPMRGPDLHGPGEPAEDPEIEIDEIILVQRIDAGDDFDVSDLYIKRQDGSFVCLEESIGEAALVAFDER